MDVEIRTLAFVLGFKDIVIRLECQMKSHEDSDSFHLTASDGRVPDEFSGSDQSSEDLEAVREHMRHAQGQY